MRRTNSLEVFLPALVALGVGCAAAGCTGALDAGIGGGDRQPPMERGSVPLRALRPDEINNALDDVFGEGERREVDFPVARVPDRYTTFAAAQVVSPASLGIIEARLGEVASYLARSPTAIGCSVDVEGRVCVEAFSRRVLSRLYRRDATDADIQRVGQLFESRRAEEDATSALATTLHAMLMSPYFLYAWNADAVAAAGATRTRLAGFEVSERLALLLWQSVPDARLLEAARTGRLDSATGIRIEASRMMRDARFERFVLGFMREWLGVDHVSTLSREIPEWSDSLRPEMEHEVERFVGDWLENDGSMSGLFTSRRRFLSPSLAAFVQLPTLASETGRGVEASDPEHASGIFTLTAFTAAHAMPSMRFGPTKRGHWIRTHLLCGVIGSPPPTALADAPEVHAGESTRQWHERLMENSYCGGCHSRMDNMGFSLEHYDGAGRFRMTDSGHAINTSARVGESQDVMLDGAYDSISGMAQGFAGSPVVADCMAQHLTEYALGTDQSRATLLGTVPRRSIAIRPVSQALLTQDFTTAMLELVTSDAFLTTARETR